MLDSCSRWHPQVDSSSIDERWQLFNISSICVRTCTRCNLKNAAWRAHREARTSAASFNGRKNNRNGSVLPDGSKRRGLPRHVHICDKLQTLSISPSHVTQLTTARTPTVPYALCMLPVILFPQQALFKSVSLDATKGPPCPL